MSNSPQLTSKQNNDRIFDEKRLYRTRIIERSDTQLAQLRLIILSAFVSLAKQVTFIAEL